MSSKLVNDNEDKTIPFPSVLDELFNDDTVPVHLLFRLSDMAVDEAAEFQRRWLEVTDERRRVIMRHLADLMEENFAVDFAPVFVFALEDRLPEVRIAALDGLWDSTDIRLIGPITRLMQSDEADLVRAAAAAALAHYLLLAEWGQLPDRIIPGIVEPLLAEYDNPDTAVAVRRAALEALGAASHPRVADIIEEAYEDSDPAMQMSAVFAMGNTADRRWIPTLIAEMESHNPDMRAEAARAAGLIGSSDAIAPLGNLTVDEDVSVRLAAVIALGQIGSETAQEILTALLHDEEQAELHEAVEEALEEQTILSGELALLDLDLAEDDPLDETRISLN
ncbi:MAG TPA: HEAT repeat domain-containing protein [Anaerolineae bacterium]|nr:HEAT repeat domain-containing protein [Anaerolineae bacterium]